MSKVITLQIPVTQELNERIFSAAKLKGLSKRDYIAEVLEEKLEESRPQSAKTSGTGNHEVGDQ